MSTKTKRKPKTNGCDTISDQPNRLIGRDTIKAERLLRNDRPDLYALRKLLRSDRKRTGGWVRLGKFKGAYA